MLDRKTPPAFRKSNSFSLIKPEKIILPNGVRITVVPGGEQEVTKVEFIFKAGKWNESYAGVSYFTAQLLQKGTATKNSFQISGELDQHGMHLEIVPGYDFTSLSLYGLTKNMGRFFELMHEVITRSVFPESELQQAKDIYIQGLKINLEKTSYLASRQLRQSLFGSDHPYGHDTDIQDVQQIQRVQLADFHEKHFRDVDIICSGKITNALVHELEKTFGHLSVLPSPAIAHQRKGETGQTIFVKKENSVQTTIRMGKPAISRLHADYPTLLLLNQILGGYFGSRLMKNIREEKGLTYGIYSSINAMKHDSYLSMGADVDKQNRELAIQEIKHELKNLQTNLIGPSELENARNHFIGSVQAEITTPFAHADKIKNMILYSLPDDFYPSLLTKMDSVKDSDLLEAARKYLQEDSFSIVAVG